MGQTTSQHPPSVGVGKNQELAPQSPIPPMVPHKAPQPSAAQDVGLEQDVDGVPLERDRESGAGQGPRDVDPPDAMNGAIDPGDLSVEPSRTVAVIEVPPAPRGGVVVE